MLSPRRPDQGHRHQNVQRSQTQGRQQHTSSQNTSSSFTTLSPEQANQMQPMSFQAAQNAKNLNYGTQIAPPKPPKKNTPSPDWVKTGNSGELQWQGQIDGLTWFCDEKTLKMHFRIENEGAATKEWLEFYNAQEGIKRNFRYWTNLFKESDPKLVAAKTAANHTTGPYAARNAVISILTKHDLLNKCTADNWSVFKETNSETILEDFKKTYSAMLKTAVNDNDERNDYWINYFDQSLPLIKAYQALGNGDEKHAGSKVNRGDGNKIVEVMGLMGNLNQLSHGKHNVSPAWTAKFPGITSTAKGDDPSTNQYATNSSIVWILTVAERHHAFDFKEITGDGYPGENELTFPMGVQVEIDSVIAHKDDQLTDHRPSGCNKAEYVIYGRIF